MSTQIGVQFGASEMERPLRVVETLVAVSRLPEGPRRVRDVWYESQKEHWVGWLFHYKSAGARPT